MSARDNKTAAPVAGALNAIARRALAAASLVKGARGAKRYGLAFAAGVAGALALAPFYAWPLMALAFSTLVLLMDGSHGGANEKRRAFVAGWYFGFGYFLAGMYWMAFSFFVQADEFAWMAPFAVLGGSAFIALFPAIALWLACFAWTRSAARIFALAVAWTVVEYLRGHILTGLPWNLTGQALAFSAYSAQSAAWYGAYGLSLAATLLFATPAAFLFNPANRPRDLWRGLGVFIVLVGFIFALGAGRIAMQIGAKSDASASGAPIHLRIVQPNIAQRQKIDPAYWAQNFNRLLELSSGVGPDDGALFIVWPENAAPLLDEAPGALEAIARRLPENAVLVGGAVRREYGQDGQMRFFNSLFVETPGPNGRSITHHYDKHHLVPFGEYLPWTGVLNAIGLAQLAPYDDGFTPGAGPQILSVNGTSFAPLICYEVIFPGALYPRGERPAWLLTVTNDAWFGDTSGPRQHLDQARLRAIETGLAMARSANTGISALIDPYGRVISRIALYREGRIDAPLPRALTPTLYARLGDWTFFAFLFACTFAGLLGAPRKGGGANSG